MEMLGACGGFYAGLGPAWPDNSQKCGLKEARAISPTTYLFYCPRLRLRESRLLFWSHTAS